MRVLLIRPPDPVLERLFLWPPIGLAYLAAPLRERHDVALLDCLAERMDADALVDHVVRTRPDVVGFSTPTQSLDATRACIRRLREVAPAVTPILGGPHASGDPLGAMLAIPELPYAFRGEADLALPMLLDRLADDPHPPPSALADIPGLVVRDGDEVRVPPPAQADLDALPRPARDLLAEDRYPRNAIFAVGRPPHAMLSITRGCPEGCLFCGTGAITGPGFRTRDVDDVLAEIDELRAARDVRTLLIVDDNLTADRAYALELFGRMADRFPDLQWSPLHGLRLDTLDPDLVRAMDRAGCCFFYAGIESGSQAVLDRMAKGTTLDAIRAQVAMVRRVSDIGVGGYFILGYPGEGEDEIRATARFARELRLDRAVFLPATLSPGSAVYERARREDRLPDPRTIDFGVRDGYELLGRLEDRPQVPLERLQRLHLSAYLRFYLAPRVLLRLPGRVSPRGLIGAAGFVRTAFGAPGAGRRPLAVAAALLLVLAVTIAAVVVASRGDRSGGDGAPAGPSPRAAERAAALDASLVRAQPGWFSMGSPVDGRSRDDDENLHVVRLSRPYLISAREVDQALYRAVMGTDPAARAGDPALVGPSLPVHGVTWFDALRFCNSLSRVTGRTPVYTIEGDEVTWDRGADGYRLPTEAEWEYAARAGGRDTRFAGTDDPGMLSAFANLADRSLRAARPDATELWFLRGDDGFPFLAPTGSLQPNEWDLYDMNGNVSEWVWDRYGDYELQGARDPSGPWDGELRVVRGGSWRDDEVCSRAATREAYEPFSARIDLGFRVARTVD